MTSKIQWNCQGYSAKYEDIRCLISKHNPHMLLLHETMLGGRIPRPPTGYEIVTDGDLNHTPGHGLCTLIRNGIP